METELTDRMTRTALRQRDAALVWDSMMINVLGFAVQEALPVPGVPASLSDGWEDTPPHPSARSLPLPLVRADWPSQGLTCKAISSSGHGTSRREERGGSCVLPLVVGYGRA